MISNEWGDARHEGCHVQKNVEKDVKTCLLLIDALFSLHSWSVESYVPVGQLVEES